LDRNETIVKNVNEELPYESTGAHKNKSNVEDIFEKVDITGNVVGFYISKLGIDQFFFFLI
jgi:hypothetical protein